MREARGSNSLNGLDENVDNLTLSHMEMITRNMRCGTWTDKGVRRRNEDCTEVDRTLDAIIIADGMGGHPAGDEASKAAVAEVLRVLRTSDAPARFLREAVLMAHQVLASEGDNRGSTITALLVVGKELLVAHVGDCRLHVDGRLITEDHGSGEMLHHFLGGKRTPHVATYTVPVRTGSWIVMTTDGIHDSIPVMREMPRLIMSTHGQVEEIARSLVRQAIRTGSTDNCTCAVAQVL